MFNVILFVWRKVDVNLFFVRLFGLLWYEYYRNGSRSFLCGKRWRNFHKLSVL